MKMLRVARIALAVTLMAAGRPGQVCLSAQTNAQTAWAPATTPDGQPDIQGYWNQRNNVTTYSLERGDEDRREHNRITGQRAATGRPIVDPPSGLIPYQSWAAAKYRHLLSVHTGPTRIEDLDPVARAAATPRAY